MTITKEELNRLQEIRRQYNDSAHKLEWWVLTVTIDILTNNNGPRTRQQAINALKEALCQDKAH